ncbi:MAG: NAD(P)/FAD-dependent oxidoreductase [Arthrobacter sp.]
MESHFDVAIIGGGPAGLAAAQVLGRQRRRVVLVDDDRRRNAAASTVHMLMGREGTTPAGLVLAGRQELAGLPAVSLLASEATKVLVEDSKIAVWTAALEITADFLILATGVVDELPPIPGIGAAYGRCLFHCPLCHGFEVRDQRLVVVGKSEHAAFMAAYVHDRISRDVQLYSDGEPSFSRGTRNKLSRNRIRIIEDKIAGIEAPPDGLTLKPENSAAITFHAGFLAVRYRQRSALAQELGCSLTDDGRVGVDHFQRSSVPRVFAVGDMSRMVSATGNMTFVATAIAGGLTAGAFLDEHIFAKTWDSQAV